MFEDDESIIKCEIKLSRIFYPKNVKSVETGEYAIFAGTVVVPIENCCLDDIIKFKGNVPVLEYGTSYKVTASLADHHEIYGDTYEILYMGKKINISNKESQKELLSTILPEKTVENLFNTYDDIVSLLEKRNTEALCKVKGITEFNVNRLYRAYDDTKDYSQIFVELSRSGLSGNLIKKITDYYKSPEKALDVIRKTPYELVTVDGIGFKKADEIALKMGVDKFDCQRIKGYLIHVLLEQAELGRSYLHYSELMKMLYDTLGFVPEEIVNKTAQIMIDDGKIHISENGENIGLIRYYNLEKDICDEIVRLMIENPNIKIEDTDNIEENIVIPNSQYVPRKFNVSNPDEIILEVEQEQGFDFTEEQKNAIYTCLDNRVIAITGGAGTGKTSTANGICKMFKGYSVLAVALSGKAALRITEATGLPASTIHKALGWFKGTFIHNKNNPLEVDIVLIDEATMINGSLFKNLLEAIPTGAKVIIMGDVQQLTPIGNCQVFADILSSGTVPTIKLTKLHRQALKSGIIPTSVKVTNQEQLFSNTYQGSEIIGELQDMELNITTEKCNLSDYVVEKFKQEYTKFKDINEVQIVSAMKTRGDLSCYNLNTKIQAIYNPVSDDDDFIEIKLSESKGKSTDKSSIKKYKIKKGDKVINIKNNYTCMDLDGNICPVFNGNMGIVTSVTKNGITINFVGVGEVWFGRENFKNLELGYCITTHKSQGSGFLSTIIALDRSSYIMNNAELLYTAITRAKKYCVLVATNSAVRGAINHKEVNNKQTYLRDMLSNREELKGDIANE